MEVYCGFYTNITKIIDGVYLGNKRNVNETELMNKYQIQNVIQMKLYLLIIKTCYILMLLQAVIFTNTLGNVFILLNDRLKKRRIFLFIVIMVFIEVLLLSLPI